MSYSGLGTCGGTPSGAGRSREIPAGTAATVPWRWPPRSTGCRTPSRGCGPTRTAAHASTSSRSSLRPRRCHLLPRSALREVGTPPLPIRVRRGMNTGGWGGSPAARKATLAAVPTIGTVRSPNSTGAGHTWRNSPLGIPSTVRTGRSSYLISNKPIGLFSGSSSGSRSQGRALVLFQLTTIRAECLHLDRRASDNGRILPSPLAPDKVERVACRSLGCYDRPSRGDPDYPRSVPVVSTLAPFDPRTTPMRSHRASRLIPNAAAVGLAILIWSLPSCRADDPPAGIAHGFLAAGGETYIRNGAGEDHLAVSPRLPRRLGAPQRQCATRPLQEQGLSRIGRVGAVPAAPWRPNCGTDGGFVHGCRGGGGHGSGAEVLRV